MTTEQLQKLLEEKKKRHSDVQIELVRTQGEIRLLESLIKENEKELKNNE